MEIMIQNECSQIFPGKLKTFERICGGFFFLLLLAAAER